MKLLSINSDPKTVKGLKYGYLSAVQYLLPYNFSGKNLCPQAKNHKCHETCLVFAGRGQMNSVWTARANRTRFFLEDKDGYFKQLRKELKEFVTKAKKLDLKPAFRFNGLSDLPYHKYGIIEEFPEIKHYNYTKIIDQKIPEQLSSSYDLTYSYSGAYPQYPEHMRWATVFKGELPKTFHGRKVVDGDKHDLTFTHPKNVVLGLKAKGKAKTDTTGFVVNLEGEKL